SNEIHFHRFLNYFFNYFFQGITLWDAEMLQRNINVRPQPNTDFKIIATDSSEDKANALNVSASLEASFLCGLVSVKGSADYLNNKKSSKHQSRVTLQYYTTSRFEQLTMEHLGAGNVKHCNVFQEGSATHVVTALLYGAQAFFIFDREVSSNENHQKIQGDLQASIKKIPLISIEGQASLKMNEMEQEKIDKFSCTFHGDFALEINPVSYVDAIKVYSEPPKLLGEHGENAVPMTVWLYPLKKLDSAATQLVREISVSLLRRAQRIMDELHNCDNQCQDLMRDNIAIQFPEITAKISNCKDLCSEYKIVFQKHLCRLLPSIRGGGKEEQELIDALNDKEISPFKGALVTKYLNEREREMNVVRSYLDIMKDVPVLSSSNDLDKVILKASNNYVIAFALTSLNEKDPYLSDLENYLKAQSCNNGEQISFDQNSSKKTEKWFSSGDATILTRATIQAFLDFKEANKGRKNIEFCIASIPDELSTASSINVYERGRLISSQYELPSKPPIPVFLSAEHDCIHLQIKPPDRGVSCVDSYCISYQSAQSSESKICHETKIETKSIKELKDNFMAAKGKFMDTKQMLDALEKEFHGIEDKLMKLIKLSSDCIRRLDEIALKPNSLSTAEYLEILIKTEKEEKSPGFEDRIVGLEKMKQETLILEKIAKGENLLEKERQMMVEREKRMKTVALKILKMKKAVSAL
uniref:Uncharacterized protein n=1 Tax=Sinocyclocheilus rhinocerous TaxID=307959 RepID=A0A673HN65_9TELE